MCVCVCVCIDIYVNVYNTGTVLEAEDSEFPKTKFPFQPRIYRYRVVQTSNF